MNAKLVIWKDKDTGMWNVMVRDCNGEELFYNKTAFKFTAYISYHIWKKIMRHFDKSVEKEIKL